MRRQRHSELARSQDSVFYMLKDSMGEKSIVPIRAKYVHELYPHMLIEDVRLGIMPITVYKQKKQFRIFVAPPDSKTEQIIADALVPDHYRQGVDSAVCDFVSECAARILVFEQVVYEIVYLSKPKDGTVVGFELTYIHPGTLTRKGGNLLQFLPADVAKELKKPQYIKFSPERLLIFKPPAHIQGKMDQIMESLARLSVHTLPDFVMKDLAAGTKRTPFDVKAHFHTSSMALASACKLLGWNARQLFQKEALECYLIYRELVFQRFKIELRDGIIQTLNEGVERAGRVIGFSGRIDIEGLPTIRDVESARNHLVTGDLPFNKILDPFLGF